MFNSITVANSLYFKKVLENNYSKEEISQYDILSASAMDELTRSANNGHKPTNGFFSLCSL